MMFNLLFCKIKVKAGNGGNGLKSISRGASGSILYHGGSGGKGGNIIFQRSEKILINNEFHGNFITAQDGEQGRTGTKDGKNGKDKMVFVSQHTKILDKRSKQICEINEQNPNYIIYGGIGGLGSRVTKSSKFTEKNLGQVIEQIELQLSVILPIGIFHIFCTNNIELSRLFIKQNFGYQANISGQLVCLNINGKVHYIMHYRGYETIKIFQQHAQKFDLINIYTDIMSDYSPLLEFINKNSYPYTTSLLD